MKMVIGGAFQGKRRYASEKYKIEERDWLDGNVCSMEELWNGRAVMDFHLFLRRQMKREKDAVRLAASIWEKNPDLILVTNEVGYGVVPIDKEEREWREFCGRVCTVLASHAEEVTRVCCGIGQPVKG